jgi:hypothetical protein
LVDKKLSMQSVDARSSNPFKASSQYHIYKKEKVRKRFSRKITAAEASRKAYQVRKSRSKSPGSRRSTVYSRNSRSQQSDQAEARKLSQSSADIERGEIPTEKKTTHHLKDAKKAIRRVFVRTRWFDADFYTMLDTAFKIAFPVMMIIYLTIKFDEVDQLPILGIDISIYVFVLFLGILTPTVLLWQLHKHAKSHDEQKWLEKINKRERRLKLDQVENEGQSSIKRKSKGNSILTTLRAGQGYQTGREIEMQAMVEQARQDEKRSTLRASARCRGEKKLHISEDPLNGASDGDAKFR